jgi:hypothetical protein
MGFQPTIPEAPMSQPTTTRPAAQVSSRQGFDRQVRYGRILGLVFCVAGFVTIGFGWNGMAKLACPDCQLPYLLSGGAAGGALVLLGVGLLVMAQFRSERMKLTDELQRVGSIISRAIAASPAAGTASSNGRVVAGKSTYHRPDCRLVEGKSDLDLMTIGAAKASGLTACRVCNPEQGDVEEGSVEDEGAVKGKPEGSGDTPTSRP